MTTDRVMERLAKLLADAAAPPNPRERLKDALVKGNFDELLEKDDIAD